MGKGEAVKSVQNIRTEVYAKKSENDDVKDDVKDGQLLHFVPNPVDCGDGLL